MKLENFVIHAADKPQSKVDEKTIITRKCK